MGKTSEDYLDSLLRAAMEPTPKEEKVEENQLSENDVADLFAVQEMQMPEPEPEVVPEPEPEPEVVPEPEPEVIPEFVAEEPVVEEPVVEEENPITTAIESVERDEEQVMFTRSQLK